MTEPLSVNINLRVTPTLARLLRKAAKAERRSLSNFARIKLEQAVICPTCDGETTAHPDSIMKETGVRYCTACNEPVLSETATGEPATRQRAAGKRVTERAADSPLASSEAA